MRGTTKLDFDFFMKNDKSFVDKNSIQRKMIEEEMKVRKEIQKKLELTGGYVDPNMRTYEITEAKVIIDLCGKFQFTKP